ncbi:MAG: hypothetical protein HYU70_05240 [Bacteroidetes bacterium]|nr:hypothetical protein [Bacteroidota bacterium]
MQQTKKRINIIFFIAMTGGEPVTHRETFSQKSFSEKVVRPSEKETLSILTPGLLVSKLFDV